MSVSKWAYDQAICDGGGCPGDCDLCDKPKNMEDIIKDTIVNEIMNGMDDYIKRSDAIRAMAQYMMDTALIDNPEASDRIEEWEGSIAAPVMSTVEVADVRENVRGKWQITDAYPHNVYCSVCHKKFAQTHWAVWEDGSLPRNYCPNCGAQMMKGGDA